LIVATATAENRDLNPEESVETERLLARMKTLDQKRRAQDAGTFDGLLRDVRSAPSASADWSPPSAASPIRGDSLGGQLVRSDAFRQFLGAVGHGRPVSMQPIELRAAGTPMLPPSTGYPALTTAPPPSGPLAPWGAASVAGLFPSLPAQGGSISYLRDSRTGLEAPVIPTTGIPAGTLKPETPVNPTLIEQALIVLATWSKVSNVVPEDIAGFSSWIDSILAAGVFDAESAYVISVILGTPGIITSAAGGANVADALLTAAMEVQTRSHLPATGAILAPDVFAALATAKADTAGTYLSGQPLSAAPSMSLWGQLSLVVSAAMAAGTALVVAGRAGALYRKGTLRVDISDSNEDDFVKNLLTVRIEERVAFATYKATGFANVTGLVAP
jgi:hypothetical protein